MSKLYPNLDPGKTEAILSLVGPASRRLQAQLFRHEDAYFALSPKVHPPDSLRLVAKYRHLGGIFALEGLA